MFFVLFFFFPQVLLRVSVYLTLSVYCICSLLAAVAAWFLPIETAGRALQESTQLNNNKPQDTNMSNPPPASQANYGTQSSHSQGQWRGHVHVYKSLSINVLLTSLCLSMGPGEEYLVMMAVLPSPSLCPWVHWRSSQWWWRTGETRRAFWEHWGCCCCAGYKQRTMVLGQVIVSIYGKPKLYLL